MERKTMTKMTTATERKIAPAPVPAPVQNPRSQAKFERLNTELFTITRELNAIAKTLENGRLYHYTTFKRDFTTLGSRLAALSKEV